MAITKQDLSTTTLESAPERSKSFPPKPCRTQRDLSPGLHAGRGRPCLEIEKDPASPTNTPPRGNLVAVVSNGTAVLGLGNIGALAGKPVMEGKAVLFKRFADIDVFDIELDTRTRTRSSGPADCSSPPSAASTWKTSRRRSASTSKKTLKQDDEDPGLPRRPARHRHHLRRGAAKRARDRAARDIDRVKVVFNGAGARGISCAAHYVQLGVRRENIMMCDTKGVIYKGRTEGMNPYKERFAAGDRRAHPGRSRWWAPTSSSGCPAQGAFTPEMMLGMAPQPDHFRDGQSRPGNRLR